jgi:hypothetical protein
MSSTLKQDEKVAFIKGEVLSINAKEVRIEWIVDNPIRGIQQTFIAEIDSNSNFLIEIPIERIALGRISAGKYHHEICLIPGDDLYIRLIADTIEYSGKGAEKNNFLYHAEINGLMDSEYYKEFNKGD